MLLQRLTKLVVASWTVCKTGIRERNIGTSGGVFDDEPAEEA